MHMHLIAVGNRMPAWIKEGFQEFNRRLSGEYRLDLVEIPPAKKSKSMSVEIARKQESDAIRRALPGNALVVVLEVQGRQFTSTSFALQLQQWLVQGKEICFVVGGADGLDDEIRESADLQWSLSGMTLPHALVRVLIAEQVYRAWSILNHHPYHRE